MAVPDHFPVNAAATLLLMPLLATIPACAPRPTPEPPRAERVLEADTARATELAPGVTYTHLWLARGPWAVHVLEVDGSVCTAEIDAIKPGPPLEARATTSALAGDALAAINADFFMLPGGTPVGAHVHDGRVLAGPGTRPIYALDSGARQWAGLGVLSGWVAGRADTVALVQVNRPRESDRHRPLEAGVWLFDLWFGTSAPVDPAGWTIRVRRLGSHRGVVASVHPPGDPVPLDERHVALQADGQAGRAWLGRRTAGDTVDWRAAVVRRDESRVGGGDAGVASAPREDPRAPESESGAGALEAVGGFPVLVSGGRGVYADQEGVNEAFGELRHPRTAVGWDEPGGRLFWVVVDGRQPPYSEGMSLPELEWLFLRLGATEAINLDGGGSSAMVIAGRVANRPPDSEGERAVGNALVLNGCGAAP